MPTPAQLGANTNTVWRGPDYLAPNGAQILARKIEAYWRQRGFEVMIYLRSEAGVVCLRSNLVNGRPHPGQALIFGGR